MEPSTANTQPTNSFPRAQEASKISAAQQAEELSTAIADARVRFAQRYPKSKDLHEQALKSLPGGNTTSLLFTTPFPVSMKSGEGYKVTDDGGHTQVALNLAAVKQARD
jgi:hypothetical protein